MAPTTRILLLLLVSSIAIIPVLASRELIVQNAQQQAKVVGNENIHTNTSGAKRMLESYGDPVYPAPGRYPQPPECPPTCDP